MNTVITESGHKVEISTGTATETAAHDGFGSFGKRPRGIAESAIREASDLLNRALKGNKRSRAPWTTTRKSSFQTYTAIQCQDMPLLRTPLMMEIMNTSPTKG